MASQRPAATQARSSAADPPRRSALTRPITLPSVRRPSARPGPGPKGLLVVTSASISAVRVPTARRCAPHQAPWPRTAWKTSSRAASHTTPSSTVPRTASARLTA